jgi:hypothetical protein
VPPRKRGAIPKTPSPEYGDGVFDLCGCEVVARVPYGLSTHFVYWIMSRISICILFLEPAMLLKFIRSIAGAVTKAFTSVANKKSRFQVDPTLPHGIPFSFNPASVDIHRVIREESKLNGYVCEKCNRKVIGLSYSFSFELNSEFYSSMVIVAKTEDEAKKKVEQLIMIGGEIGSNDFDEVKYAVPGVVYFFGYCLGEVYELEFPDRVFRFD